MSKQVSVDVSLESLFEQLGLDGDPRSRADFVADHGPVPSAVLLADAGFWNASQRAFIKEAIAQDAEWAPVVGQLDALLRSQSTD